MIEFRTFGALDLRGSDGTVIQSVLAQPKRAALLAYLASEQPGSFHRRDTLVGLFWPETDDRRARNALSQALHYLRRSLGHDVILARGTEEIAVNPEVVRCDAVAFEAAAREGRLEEALEWYAGEFLNGVYVHDAPGFERWLDGARARYADMAVEAAWQLVAAAEARGDEVAARRWAARIAALRPDDEDALRRMIEFYGRLGDYGAAVRAYDEFARRLAEDLDAEPSPRTRAVLQAIRPRRTTDEEAKTGLDAGEAAEEGAEEPAEVAPAIAPSSERHDVRPSRGILGAGLALLVVVLVLTARVFGLGAGESSGASISGSVAVLPFTVRGDERVGYLAPGMVDLLAAKLEGVPGLRPADPRAVLSIAEEREAAGPDRAAALAGRLGAEYFILGDVLAHEGALQLSASLYASGTGEAIAQASVEGRGDELFALVDRLAADLLAGFHHGPAARLTRLAATTTASLPALKAYLRGESELRAGRYVSARDAFQEAVTIDSTFALAYYRLAVAAGWAGPVSGTAMWAADQALRHDARLVEHDRLLLRAFRAYIARDAIEAERLYREALAARSDDVEAWYQLGEVQFHYGPLLGRPLVEARNAFEQVLALVPDHGESIMHLARIAAAEGDRVRFRDLAERYLAQGPDADHALEIEALRAWVFGDAARRQAIVSSVHRLGDHSLLSILNVVAVYTQDLATAAELARALASIDRSEQARALGHAFAAYIAAATGRWRAAVAELAGLEAIDPAEAAILHAWFLVSPFAPEWVRTPEALREQVRRLATLDDRPPSHAIPMTLEQFRILRRYLEGMIAVRMGEYDEAATIATEIERLEGPRHDPNFGPGLAHVIHASIAWARGDVDAAHHALRRIPLGPQRSTGPIAFFAQAWERFLWGEVLAALGKDDDALRWFASFPEPGGYDLLFLAPAHLRRAEIHRDAAAFERAVHHFGCFLDLWADADPEMQPLLDHARRNRESLQDSRR